MNKSIIKQIITLQKTRFLNFYHVIYENKMGQEKNWFIASRKDEMQIKQQLLEDKKDKVDAVLLNVRHQDENKLVIIKQYRVPLNDYIYELPAGLIDEGEDLFEAAARELKEEYNVDINVLGYLGKEENETTISHIFHAEISNGIPALGGEEKDKNNEDNYYEIKRININANRG